MIKIKDGAKRNFNETGFFSGIPNEVYHSREGISSSRLDSLIHCPAKYYNIRKPTSAMDFGTAFHTYFLEPEIFDKTYGIQYEPNGTTKAARDEKQALLDKGYENLIKETALIALQKMKESILRHPISSILFKATEYYTEHSGYWESDGVLCRFRPDYMLVHNDQIFVVDLKTTTDCAPYKISQSIGDWGYHRQAVFYTDGVKKLTGCDDVHAIHFFVENAESWTIEQLEKNSLQSLPVAIPECDLEQGRREYEQALNNYRRWFNKDSDNIPGYKEMEQLHHVEKVELIEVSLPHFKKDFQNRSLTTQNKG